MKKFLLSLTLTIGIISISLAQDNKMLQGVWKLHKSKDANGTEIGVPPIFYKFFQIDGKFTNLALRQNGLIASHKGEYIFDIKNNSYVEDVQSSEQHQSAPILSKNILKILFSDDHKTITLEGLIDVSGGKHALYEVWTKVD